MTRKDITEVDVITPTFHSKKLIELMIRSFEKFKPDNFFIRYIIVENSDDVSYKEETLNICENITWINNPTSLRNSAANAIGVEVGLKNSRAEYVFISHCDTLISSKSFIPLMIKKVSEGNELVGTVLDNNRIKAIHQSGMIVRSDIIRSANLYPGYEKGEMIYDVCDSVTQKCRNENILHTCFKNTFNEISLIENLTEPYRSFHVDRCLDSQNNVMFMHLGRGIEKQFGEYHKPNRVYFPQWVNFCENIIR